MNLSRILIYCFGKWWRPVLLVFITGLIFVFSVWKNIPFIQMPVFILYCFAFAALVFSFIYQLWYKRWFYSILTLFFLAATVIISAFSMIALFFIAMNERDTFADNLKIPSHIELHNPVDLSLNNERPDSILALHKIKEDFQLYNSFQPGLYEYDIWISKIDSGTIYLKAYEITQNYPLSTNRLPLSSSVKIYNPSDSIVKFGTHNNFTIYEGDWDKPYAARFEVWFKPKRGGDERKLFEKNYIIEGWMR